MSYAKVTYTGNGATTDYNFSFPYLDASHVHVYLDGVETTDFILNTSTQVRLDVAAGDGVKVTIVRETPITSQQVDWTNGSTLVDSDLDAADLQVLYATQEQSDKTDDALSLDLTGVSWDALNKKIDNVATPTASDHAATKGYVDDAITTSEADITAAVAAASASASAADASADSAAASAAAASAAETAAQTAETNAETAETNAEAAQVAAEAAQAAAESAVAATFKNAVVDFGAVGDDSTNNDAAMTAAISYVNATGGFVYWPRGIYRFNTAPSTITTKGGGFIGAGSGMIDLSQNSGPAAGGVYGTVFRRNYASGDLLVLGSGNDSGTSCHGFTVRDIGFWPVPFTTSGYEIHDRGNDTLIENVHGAYTYGLIKSGSGANASTYRHIRANGIWGEGGITTRGGSSSISDWAQGLTIDDFECYNPMLATPTAAKHKGNWATSTSYAQYDTVVANGYIWQASVAGTSLGSGSGPAITGLYSFAGAPTTALFTDNNITWRMIASSTSACVLIDSNSVVVNVINSLLVGPNMWGVYFNNSLGSGIVPQSVKMSNTLIDHTIGDGVNLQYGYEISLDNCDSRYSISGRGLTGAATFTGNLNIDGGQFWQNALDGIQLPPITAANVCVTGARFTSNGVKTANTYSGILVGTGTTKFQIIGCLFGVDPSAGGTPKYGIDLAAGCSNFSIQSNISLGNGTAGYSVGTARNVSTEIFQNNIGTLAAGTADQEGSWTPVVRFATVGDTNAFTYTHQAGRYIIKDGWCTAEFSIQTGAVTHTTASGDVQITGLPVAHVSVTGLITGSPCIWSKFTKAGYTGVIASFNGSTTTLNFVTTGSGQNVSTLTAADHTSGDGITLRGTITFKVV